MASHWLQLAVCSLAIAFAGSRLTRVADAIGEKTGMSASWVGVLLLAAVTSLPELATGIDVAVERSTSDATGEHAGLSRPGTGDDAQHLAFANALADAMQEVAMRQVLHGEVMQLLVRDADIVDRDDVRMREHREDLGLTDEPLPHALIRICFQQHDLDGHGAVEFAILGLQHAAHAAGGDLWTELVVLHPERWWCWELGVGGHECWVSGPVWKVVFQQITSPALLAATPVHRGSPRA